MTATKAKAPPKAPAKKCGAVRKGKPPCGRPAGWGTKHPGRGRCKHHGGSTPNHEKAAVNEEANDFAAANLTIADADRMDPTDSLVLSVHLAQGVVNFYRDKARTQPEYHGAYLSAIERLNRFSKAAVDGKVAERLAAIGERAGEQIALVCEAGLAALVQSGVKLTSPQRTAYAKAIGEGVRSLEQDGPIELPPGSDA